MSFKPAPPEGFKLHLSLKISKFLLKILNINFLIVVLSFFQIFCFIINFFNSS